MIGNTQRFAATRRQILGLGLGAAAAAIVQPAFASTGQVGFAMETFTVPRWKYLDRPNFEQAVQAAHLTPIVVQADFKVDQQLADVENLLTRGIDCLALVAIIADAGVNMARRAKRAGVPVVAYNTSIPSKDVDVYVARNNNGVGRKAVEAAAALGVLSGNWVIVSGQAGNAVATEMTQGYMDALKPYLDSGKVKIVSQKFHEGWDPESARRQADDALTAAGNSVQGFLCNNDDMAAAAIGALEKAGLAGKVFVSGMDATTTGCKLILAGKMALSSFTRFDVMGKTAGELCARLAAGQKIETTQTYDAGNGIQIPYVPIEDFNVTKENIVSYIKTYNPGYVDAKEILKSTPKSSWPAGAEGLL